MQLSIADDGQEECPATDKEDEKGFEELTGKVFFPLGPPIVVLFSI